ncbi:MAG: hypothetical protein HOI53_02695 [Francisellaceae bacterium]|nr:hypothetical protein [Francisellaceae bacterium]MBT6206912.1 hypothetical protein [Francisellaceae bacterium]MBT6539170.1 hypothetical protein [Francisellaceae bacterium]
MFNFKTFGATFIIAGSTIGAGMLGLPVVMGLFGLIPGIIMMFLVWAFMLSTAFMLLEANSWFKEEESVNLISLAHVTMGRLGSIIVWATYGFLFYSLMVAYIIKGGDLLFILIGKNVEIFSKTEASYLFVACLSFFIVWRGAKVVDIFNQIFMFGLMVAYITLIWAIAPFMDYSLLDDLHSNNYVFLVPFIIIAFGFHNMIPSIFDYLNRDVSQTKKAIIYGSLIPMVLYIIWIVVALGVLDYNEVAKGFSENKIATELMSDIGASIVISTGALVFSFFAILTSLLGQGLSLRDFLIDGFSLLNINLSKFIASALCIFPALFFSYTWPQIFFECLQIAGGIAATVLFGILPPIILLQGRYKFNKTGSYRFCFNKKGLYSIALLSTMIFVYQSYLIFIK